VVAAEQVEVSGCGKLVWEASLVGKRRGGGGGGGEGGGH
jgi:hypothetical protein